MFKHTLEFLKLGVAISVWKLVFQIIVHCPRWRSNWEKELAEKEGKKMDNSSETTSSSTDHPSSVAVAPAQAGVTFFILAASLNLEVFLEADWLADWLPNYIPTGWLACSGKPTTQ